ncbi:unnamed protein product [Chilo suppressalis]|uniref:Peptidase S1 domain-containing protein n=1 Tax=Chilo suppressalis TaxID=168631 RepID=A0ABN8AS45_CHISP|nr:unnamed protein product [Chilo suppressalis]
MIIRYGPNFPSGNYSYSNVSDVRIHPSYLANINKLFRNDIALLKTELIVLEQYGRLSVLDAATLVGHAARVFGFGIMNDGDKVGHVAELGTALQVVYVVIKKCSDFSSLCLSPKCGDMATLCRGDSGGPVIHPSGIVAVNSYAAIDLCNAYQNTHKQLTVSFGGGVIPVSRYIDWIADVINNGSVTK